MTEISELEKEIRRLKARLIKEREKIEEITVLIGKQVEREAGIWEYSFEELEAEMWRRFVTIEKNSNCKSEYKRFSNEKISGRLIQKLRNLFRMVSRRFSRTIIEKEKQFNLDRQNFINKEQVPFHLAIILSLQKIKDRLNLLESEIQKLDNNQQELFQQIVRKNSVLYNEKGSGEKQQDD